MNRETKLIHGLIDPDAAPPSPAEAAELAARVLDGATGMDTTGETTARLAARLDDGLDEEARERFDRALAADGRDFQEMAASAQLVEAVAAHLVAAPADLLAEAAVASSRPVRSPRRRAPWLWLGGTVLATVLAAVLMLRHHAPQPDPQGRIMASPGPVDPAGTETPRMVPAGNPDVVPPKANR